MKTIRIDEKVLDKVPQAFRELPDSADYQLTKVEGKPGRATYVNAGYSIRGIFSIVDKGGLPAAAMFRGFSDYMSTSAIVGVVDRSQNTIIFETEGGTYKLERLSD